MQDCLGHDLERLDGIRIKYGVHVYLQSNAAVTTAQENCIRVTGADETAIPQIIDQLRRLSKDAVSKCDIRIRAYLVETPPAVLMRERIVLAAGEHFSRAYLHGKLSDAIRWEAVYDMIPEKRQVHQRNHDRLFNSVQRFLSTMQDLSGFLRMRVRFGTFIFTQFPKYVDDGSRFYFDGFCERLQHERVHGRVIPGYVENQL